VVEEIIEGGVRLARGGLLTAQGLAAGFIIELVLAVAVRIEARRVGEQ
jgi:hypothetical protein